MNYQCQILFWPNIREKIMIGYSWIFCQVNYIKLFNFKWLNLNILICQWCCICCICMFDCLSVCPWDNSKSCQQLFMNFLEGVMCDWSDGDGNRDLGHVPYTKFINRIFTIAGWGNFRNFADNSSFNVRNLGKNFGGWDVSEAKMFHFCASLCHVPDNGTFNGIVIIAG